MINDGMTVWFDLKWRFKGSNADWRKAGLKETREGLNKWLDFWSKEFDLKVIRMTLQVEEVDL
jgi:hypothetical protein